MWKVYKTLQWKNFHKKLHEYAGVSYEIVLARSYGSKLASTRWEVLRLKTHKREEGSKGQKVKGRRGKEEDCKNIGKNVEITVFFFWTQEHVIQCEVFRLVS